MNDPQLVKIYKNLDPQNLSAIWYNICTVEPLLKDSPN